LMPEAIFAEYAVVAANYAAHVPKGSVKALSQVLAPTETNHSTSTSRARVKAHLVRPERIREAAEACAATRRTRADVLYSGSDEDRAEQERLRWVTSFLQYLEKERHASRPPQKNIHKGG